MRFVFLFLFIALYILAVLILTTEHCVDDCVEEDGVECEVSGVAYS